VRVIAPDSAAVAGLSAHAMHSGSLRDAATMAGLPAIEEQTIRFPTTDPQWKDDETMLLSMSPGQWSAPQRSASGWIVIQLLGKEQHSLPFDQLPPALRQHLAEEAQARVRDARLMTVTDSLRRIVKPEVHPERLARIPWPVPGTPGE
jgi:hypothetical protein